MLDDVVGDTASWRETAKRDVVQRIYDFEIENLVKNSHGGCVCLGVG